ncbi:M4 family metallopeptidase [Nocardioides lianchengensis]|uniref:Zn-dependent metalloprotease n=1 Tax=Nocardioides lianchengensis TaxID=1045774 RepID=A0A1G6YR22_9ACTN|nr:Ig-like domain repeat protein [Nocardioides lianchengensis]NYG09555.1 Zn-dependent metalloprotease [Nocardioides lianchengensis]SDD92944.1 Zn-dependent metalloprotease [Nocardioides lianchengensis]
MKDDARGTARVTTERATGRVGFARATDLLPSFEAGSKSTAAAKAGAYLDQYAAAFGARRGELKQTGVTADAYGWTVDYAQSYRGVEVFGSQIRAQVDKQGDLTAVSGYAAPSLDLAVTPALDEATAKAKAVKLVKAGPTGVDPDMPASFTDGAEAASAKLMIYRLGSTRGVNGKAVLAWVVEVSNAKTVRETVILDAATGKPVNRWSMIAHALDRELYEAFLDDNGTPDDESDDTVGGLDEPVWTEGDAFPGTLDQDQQNEVQGTGEAYWMFRNTFGRDSYDGLGSKMITVNNDPTIACPNANWNGATTNYCSGVTSDDTVAHEWAHAYTEYTSGLVYQWQSGAMNEAYSDIWGETVDILNDRFNEGDDGTRTAGLCSQYTRGAVGVRINAPAGIAGDCDSVPASFGPVFTKAGVTTDLIVGTDPADPDGPTPTDGCSPFTNAAQIAGKFVYVDRGTCPFSTKTQHAVDAGATGIVVGNNSPTGALVSMSGDADIYGVMVDQASGTKIKSATSTVNITVKDIDEADKDTSGRWLSGEDDPAFGGAIRDMWSPTCYGDPGKVSDAEYYCEFSDSGGVHSNSGVVNHAYALLVDGGTYNGVTVPAIGLDKAANLFWRTQTAYLGQTSDFADLADGLAASCVDLTGQPINKVTLGQSATGGSAATPEAADPITTDDCAAVTAVAQATELRVEPVQCNFQPMLDKATPSLCGADFKTEVTYAEDFEDGLAGWTQDEELAFPEGSGLDWTADDSAPGDHAGSVAYGPAPSAGKCTGAAGDISSRNGLISPAITIAEGSKSMLSFDHYVATEIDFDGANVKVSVGGGEFSIVPTAAYVFNAPGRTLETAAGDNTNPMAGQAAFTGTDGNEPGGSWGTSIIDLTKIPGAVPGASVKFRFDIGRDGCGGLDGWYVDNVTVTNCIAKPAGTITATHVPEPSAYGKASKLSVSVAGEAPTGTVTVAEGSKQIANATLAAGKATVNLPKTLSAGTHRLTISYSGDDNNVASTTTKAIKVAKATSKTRASVTPKRVRAGKAVRVKALVNVANSVKPTGKVVVTLKGKRVGSATVNSKGRVTITVKRLKAGRHTLVVTYGGNGNISASKDRVTVRVVRR